MQIILNGETMKFKDIAKLQAYATKEVERLNGEFTATKQRQKEIKKALKELVKWIGGKDNGQQKPQ